MAISFSVAKWLDGLADRRVFFGKLLDLGHQDISCDVADIAAKRGHKIADGASFYKALGATEYASVDLFDERATYKWDLNIPLPIDVKFDVVTNFGTAEHLFNIGIFFENIHRLTKDGGNMIHILPVMGDVNHGFYNIHPILYDRLAKANGYEIIETQYVDDIGNRNLTASMKGLPELQLSVPYTESRVTCQQRFAMNSRNGIWHRKKDIVFDYYFVAMRKVLDHPFIVPSQY